MFYSYFAGLGLEVRVEESGSGGRLDMAVRAAGRVYLFEFKVVERAGPGAAMAQLKQRGYADKYRHLGEPVHLGGGGIQRGDAERGGVRSRTRLDGQGSARETRPSACWPPVACAARLIVRPPPSSFAATPRSLSALSCTTSALRRTDSRWRAFLVGFPFERYVSSRSLSRRSHRPGPFRTARQSTWARSAPQDPRPSAGTRPRVPSGPRSPSRHAEAFTLPGHRRPLPVRTLTRGAHSDTRPTSDIGGSVPVGPQV